MTEKDSNLPSDIQKNLASLWLVEMEYQLKWNKEFSESQNTLSKLAKLALENHDKGKTQEKGWDKK
jgi:hypothetical protein